jgi:hypothetical protein
MSHPLPTHADRVARSRKRLGLRMTRAGRSFSVIDATGELAVNSKPGMSLRRSNSGSGSPSNRSGGTTMLDTNPVTATIKHLISTGTTEQALLAAVERRFPDLSPYELRRALRVATTAAERQAASRH